MTGEKYCHEAVIKLQEKKKRIREQELSRISLTVEVEASTFPPG